MPDEEKAELAAWIRHEIEAKEARWYKLKDREKANAEDAASIKAAMKDVENALRHLELMEAMLEGKI